MYCDTVMGLTSGFSMMGMGSNTEGGRACEGSDFDCEVDGLYGYVAKLLKTRILNDRRSKAFRSYDADLAY